jgi:group I intron endonuclease
MYCIYKATNKINQKKYIGYTKNFRERKSRHHKSALVYKKPFAFYEAIRKYGWDNFEWEILYESWDGEHCLTIMEPYFISEYESFGPNGYNMDKGGRKGMLGLKRKPLTEEQKQKISIATKKNSLKGSNHPMYGSNINEKLKMAAKTSMLGKSHTEETKNKQSVARKKYLLKNPAGMQNKKHSDSTKKKISESHKSCWKLLDDSGEYETINDLMDFCVINNLNYKTVYSLKYKKRNSLPLLVKA